MELVSPSPPCPAGSHLPGLPSPATSRYELALEAGMGSSSLSEIRERVHVAVGKSRERTVGLLRWTFRQFDVGVIVLLHVHQPSPTIPTLLGKLPASQANEELLSAYRREELEQTRNILLNYLGICYRYKVKASILLIESGQVQKGIAELVSKYHIRRLVMGAASNNCMKVKRSSTKACYTAKKAPMFCEIWFVHKGKLVWTRDASKGSSSVPHLFTPETTLTEGYSPKLYHFNSFEPDFSPACPRCSSTTISSYSSARNTPITEPEDSKVLMTKDDSRVPDGIGPSSPLSSTPVTNLASGLPWPTDDKMVPLKHNLKKEELGNLYNMLIGLRKEVDKSQEEALLEQMKCKKLEAEAAEAMNRIKASELASAYELKLKKELELKLVTIKKDCDDLLGQRDKALRDLDKTKRNLAILEGHAREAAQRRDEAAEELKLIQSSVIALRQEKKKIRRQRGEAVQKLERLRFRSNGRARKSDPYAGFDDNLPEFAILSVSDLQTATCNFSESFKIGQGGYGSVYKGEILGRSVAIKKLHPHNLQSLSEFQQEVQVLSKLHHPHLVTLIGACLETWSLVYEYMPNGSLQDCLFHKTNASLLTWKTRTRIAAAVSGALYFLLSSNPEQIIHGDLRPENVLLDAEFNCKVGDLGVSRLLPEDTLRCSSFRRSTESKCAFPYTDPEFQRTGELTLKSDVYSFGIIVLQLLTGRPPVGLATDVRRAMSSRTLSSVLDPSAGEWPSFVARRLAELGIQCSEINSQDRPDITPAMVRELERLHVAEEQPVPSYFLCPILHELMHDPLMAADGFTYEGEAILGWLENGHETSPMTNLRLSNLSLTPNYTLRFAIQDWLCKSRG